MFTTAAQLLDLTDSMSFSSSDAERWTRARRRIADRTALVLEKLMVVLRDGRKLVGVLRSWDQFANIVLQSTTERIFAPQATAKTPSSESEAPAAAAAAPRGLYADIFHGIFLVRGENVLLLGEIDLDKDDLPPAGFELGAADVVGRLADEARAAEKRRDKTRGRKLARLGFEGDGAGEIVLL
ncbi:hypothetical protein LLEC1_07499 [Akanthomyces lecanii]|uniref:U6 snRNA-associated Sm-like protein LSm1 n=1 Tax=Cordyceps confragosa TaxID=2714763 RepID=A0A179I3K4_CORDF|nr:hypothetical protein LLEC1_07499 [Akanthomyces lecanii]